MINCYIDPIFLALNDTISSKHFSEVVFPKIFELCEFIKKEEEDSRERIIKFNLTHEIILNSMNFNPFRFSSNSQCGSWYRRFLSYFLKTHRNTNCEVVSLNRQIDIEFENENIPTLIIDEWNIFLNYCNSCVQCSERNLDFLTEVNLGSKYADNSLIFFNNLIHDFIPWFEDQKDFCNNQLLKVSLTSEKKKKGDWSHSHPRMVMVEVKKLLNCEYISGVRPIGKTTKFRRNFLEIVSFKTIKVAIKDRIGSQFFIVETTSVNENQQKTIFNEIASILSDFEINNQSNV
jgi:hypothetical protein